MSKITVAEAGVYNDAPRGSLEVKQKWLDEVVPEIEHKFEVSIKNGSPINTNTFPDWEWKVLAALGLAGKSKIDNDDRSDGILPGEFGYRGD